MSTTANEHGTSIIVGSYPSGVAVNPSTNIVYVGNAGDHTVAVIDGKTNNLTGTIKVGTNPIPVAVNPSINIVYVGNSSSLCRKSGQISNGSIDGLV